jgi:hypothetical protein
MPALLEIREHRVDEAGALIAADGDPHGPLRFSTAAHPGMSAIRLTA